MAARAQFRNAALIHNPQAGRWRGRRERDLDRATDLLAASGTHCQRFPTTGPGSATALTRQQVAAGRDLIIVCGGDGTINEVVNGMVGSSIPLAVLPAGTGNALATAIGLPWNVWRAAEHIPRGLVRRIALGRAGSRYFVCFAGAGFDGHGVERLNRLGPVRFKFIRATLEAYRELLLYDFPLFDIQIGSETYTVTHVLFGRLRYFALPVTPRADLFGDDFEVLLVTTRSRLLYLLYPIGAALRLLDYFPGVRYRRTQAARAVPRQGRILVETDAEVAGELPMEFSIVPDALSLLVPPAAAPKVRG